MRDEESRRETEDEEWETGAWHLPSLRLSMSRWVDECWLELRYFYTQVRRTSLGLGMVFGGEELNAGKPSSVRVILRNAERAPCAPLTRSTDDQHFGSAANAAVPSLIKREQGVRE